MLQRKKVCNLARISFEIPRDVNDTYSTILLRLCSIVPILFTQQHVYVLESLLISEHVSDLVRFERLELTDETDEAEAEEILRVLGN